MAKFHPHITENIQAFIENQHVFFVATAPLSKDSHINLSPKGLDCFKVLGVISPLQGYIFWSLRLL